MTLIIRSRTWNVLCTLLRNVLLLELSVIYISDLNPGDRIYNVDLQRWMELDARALGVLSLHGPWFFSEDQVRRQDKQPKKKIRYEMIVPENGDQTLCGYLWDREEDALSWLAQQGISGRGYSYREIEVTQCSCCKDYHLRECADE